MLSQNLKGTFKSASLFAAMSILVAACAGGQPAAPAATTAPAAPAATTAAEPTTAATAAPAEATTAPAADATAATTAAEPTAASVTTSTEATGTGKKFKGQLVISTNNGGDVDDGRFKGLFEAYKKVQPDVEL